MNFANSRFSPLSQTATRRSLLGGALALGALGLTAPPVFGASNASPGGAGSPRFISGVPLYVDPANDLARHPSSVLESWYVNAAFKSQGKVVGFEWHQGITPQGSMTEFLLMNGTDGLWRPHNASEPASDKVGAATEECRVYSSFGTFKGDQSQFQLKLGAGRDTVDVVLTPQGQELYNGTTGLLPFLGSDSYEYAFTNMLAKGSMTIDGEVFPVDASSVWFDRQWGKAETASPEALMKKAAEINQAHWTWLGMTFGEGDKSAISFWDVMEPNQRWTFLTYLREDGVQMNVGAQVDYDRVWTSGDTGQRYPAVAHIVAPAIDVDIVLTAMLDRPEFVYQPGQGHSGCQSLCQATGRAGATKIDKPVIFELIGGIDV
ncbi:lipocalin-like domain-containing protein [Pleomorphomonas sp. PLEO]|uniref:lipocalin-like domain-containing protein n=1 Tax=Pleomorphomonas sp. PLEO TaxID=3239306 RepID=UPI00351F4476